MPEIRKGSRGSTEEGGGSAPSGEGGRVNYPKNQGTTPPSSGGAPSRKVSKSGLNLETSGKK